MADSKLQPPLSGSGLMVAAMAYRVKYRKVDPDGKAVKVHDDEVPQIVVAIASPTGLEVNKVIAIVETPIILNATQTPVLKNNKSTEIKKILRNISVIIKTFY